MLTSLEALAMIGLAAESVCRTVTVTRFVVVTKVVLRVQEVEESNSDPVASTAATSEIAATADSETTDTGSPVLAAEPVPQKPVALAMG